MLDAHTSRTHSYVSMQQPGIICAVNMLPNDSLEVQGQRVRAQPDSFWSYYPGEVGIFYKVCVYSSYDYKNSTVEYFLMIYFFLLFFREQLVGIHNTLE
jgi:hypothetical protein